MKKSLIIYLKQWKPTSPEIHVPYTHLYTVLMHYNITRHLSFGLKTNRLQVNEQWTNPTESSSLRQVRNRMTVTGAWLHLEVQCSEIC